MSESLPLLGIASMNLCILCVWDKELYELPIACIMFELQLKSTCLILVHLVFSYLYTCMNQFRHIVKEHRYGCNTLCFHYLIARV
jgi:hypothetical protein